MNEVQKAFVRSINNDPVFIEICRELKAHKHLPKWRKGKTESEWAHETGFVEGIDFVLNRLGYDNGR